MEKGNATIFESVEEKVLASLRDRAFRYGLWLDNLVFYSLYDAGILKTSSCPPTTSEAVLLIKIHGITIEKFCSLIRTEDKRCYDYSGRPFNVMLKINGFIYASWIESSMYSVENFVFHKKEERG